MKLQQFPPILMLSLCSFTVPAQNPADIAMKAADAIEFESMEMSSTLRVRDAKGNERVRQITVSTRKFGTTTKTRIRFLEPAEVRGTTMIIFDYDGKDDDMWVYMPSTKKTRRIVSSEKGKSFMGSEFSNADMSKPGTADFKYQILGTEVIDGKTCWKLEARCIDAEKEKSYGYSRKVSLVEKGNYLTHRIQFFNSEDVLFKTLTYADYRKQATGKYFSFRMEAVNNLNQRKSILTVDRFNLGSKLSEEAFEVVNIES